MTSNKISFQCVTNLDEEFSNCTSKCTTDDLCYTACVDQYEAAVINCPCGPGCAGFSLYRNMGTRVHIREISENLIFVILG